MPKAMAHHLPTGAQPVPQQWPPASFPQLHMLSMMPHGMDGTFLRSLGVSCPSCATSQLLVPLQSSHWQGMRR